MAKSPQKSAGRLKVVTVILNWNGWNDTKECLESLGKIRQENFDHEILVIDNHSQDESVREIKKYFPNQKVISNSENLGFAGGNNVGLKYAIKNGADYVFILNNDTTLDENCIEELLKIAKEKQIGAVGPKIYFSPGREYHDSYTKEERGKVIWFAGGVFDWNNIIGSHRGVDQVDRGQFDDESDCDFLTGCAMLIKTEVLRKTGIFDENYFLYLEDADLSERIKRVGFKLKFAPKAIVWHKNAASQGKTGSKLQDYYIIRNRMYFAQKFARIRTKLAIYREGTKLLLTSRRRGVIDFIFGRMGKGSWL